MNNTSIIFAQPLFLLVLIPGLFFAFFPFFRLKKERRRNRNKITSLVLHIIILVLCTLVLSGFSIENEQSLKKKETFILVDVSSSTDNNEEAIEEFIQTVLDDCDSNSKVGIVTFADGAAVVSDLSSNTSGMLADYKRARKNNTGNATDIAAALKYCANLFENPKDAKIILLTDGLETENSLVILETIAGSELLNSEEDLAAQRKVVTDTSKALAQKGITVDTVYFEPVQYDRDMQINAIDFNKAVLPGEKLDFTVTVQSHVSRKATLTLYDRVDNGNWTQMGDPIEYDVQEGINSDITFKDFSFKEAGLHTIKVELKTEGDQIEENNIYYSYVNIETDKNILIIDGDGAQSAGMKTLLESMGYTVDTCTPQSVPSSAADLTDYNEVIMMNVNVKDFANGFDKELNKYVYEYGGGLLTTGGANTYYYGNMQGTLFESMLPVNVEPENNETTAIMIVLDASGSMYYDIDRGGSSDSDCFYNESSAGYQNTRMKYAKDALINAAMTVFSKKDYIGLIHFGKTANQYPIVDLPLTTAAQPGKFIAAVNGVKTIKGTSWKEPLEEAVNQLKNFTSAKHKHIIFITDGDPQDSKNTGFTQIAQDAYSYYDISLSTIAISGDITNQWRTTLQDLSKTGQGRYYECRTSAEVLDSIEDECKKATTPPTSEGEDYAVEITNPSQATKGVSSLPNVYKYNGVTTKSGVTENIVAKNDDEVTIRNDCLYASWKYGKGKVGSFASNLGDSWASSYYSDNGGKMFLQNVISMLLPEDTITSSLIVEYEKRNYTTDFFVLADTANGDNAVFYTLTTPDGKTYVNDDALSIIGDDEFMGSLENKQEGLYKLYLELVDGQNKVIDEANVYFTFSYSQEYNTFYDGDLGLFEFVNSIAIAGGGHMRSSTDDLFNRELDYETEIFDPSFLFMIIAICLFILDIIARKFNFLWPGEIIANMKKRKEQKAQRA